MLNLTAIYEKALGCKKLSKQEAEFIINTSDENLPELLSLADKLRKKYFKKKVMLCGIVNARSGNCSEDCSFCAQSGHNKAEIKKYPLLNKTELVSAAKKAKQAGVGCFSLVTSGKGLNQEKDLSVVQETLSEINGMNKCTSLGILSKAQLAKLKKAGLNKYHHNLETAKSFFQNICTTHSYADRVKTIKNAHAAGLKVCSGGIFGLGETPEQRVELGLDIRNLPVESVPINILHPIPGTAIYGKVKTLRWQDILKLIATYRFLMPDRTIGVFGGREYNLKSQQKKIFQAGANSILIGNYLTTKGNSVKADLQLLKQAGMAVKN